MKIKLMKTFLILASSIFIFQSCFKCETKDYFTLPDRVKYKGINSDAFERFLVIDSASESYVKLDDYTGSTWNKNPYYDSLFFKESIHSIDFSDSSTANINIFSYGKLKTVIKANYDKSQSIVTLILKSNPSNSDYINLFINPGSVISIPYIMNYSKKMGQSKQLINLLADNGNQWHYYSDIISNQIHSAHLNKNDTIFINKINLIYYPY